MARRPKPKPLVCPVCKKSFMPHHHQQKYCGATCRYRAANAQQRAFREDGHWEAVRGKGRW